jgi:virulence-associated protein VagC
MLAVLDELRVLGVEVLPQGDNLVIRPASKVPPELKERLRASKAEVLAALSNPKQDPPPGKPCYACGSRTFWRSVYGAVICWQCHPAANEDLIADIFWNQEAKWSRLPM